MTTQHTPGPWEVYTEGIVRMKGSVTVVAEASLYLVDKYTGHRVDRAERAANARLISAAPALLEALKVAEQRILEVSVFNNVPGSQGQKALGIIRTAITQAEGQPTTPQAH